MALLDSTVFHAVLVEPFRPLFERFAAPEHAQGGFADRSGAGPGPGGVGPVEEGQIRTGAAERIRIEKVIRRNVVLVHRLFHQAHAEETGVKIEIRGRIRSHSGDVMQATQRIGGKWFHKACGLEYIRIGLCNAHPRLPAARLPMRPEDQSYAYSAYASPQLLSRLRSPFTRTAAPSASESGGLRIIESFGFTPLSTSMLAP